MADPELIRLQTTESQPQPTGLASATNLLIPPRRVQDRLAHFPEEVYDLSPESHLVRFVKALIGDAGIGQLRKRMLFARLAQTLQGTHFFDLDRFYGALFGAKRLSSEMLGVNPYTETATTGEWAEQHGRDAAYRSRVAQLARAINYGGTPTAIELAAEALLSIDCDVYEAAGPTDRLFTIRPKRQVTLEEAYDLLRVVNRIKPVDSRCTIDWEGVEVYDPLGYVAVHSDSEYWQVVPLVRARTIQGDPYEAASADLVEQPLPPFSARQGEAWSYTGEFIGVSAYTQTPDGTAPLPTQRVVLPDGGHIDFAARDAVLSAQYVNAGRLVSDGVLVAHPYAGPRTATVDDYIDRNGMVRASPTRSRKTIAPVWADRIRLDRLVDVLRRAPGVQPVRQNPQQRMWTTPERPQGDGTEEVVEVALPGPRRVNYLAFEVAHFPHTVAAQVYDDQSGAWIEVYRRAVTESAPKYLMPGTQVVNDHPQHYGLNHWLRCSARIEAVETRRVRLVLQRGDGEPPRVPRRSGAGMYADALPVPYSLAVRGFDLGYRVTSADDLIRDADGEIVQGPIGTTSDALGSLVQFDVRTMGAAALAEGTGVWRCDAQPFASAVVSLYVDIGEADVLDGFYLDPLHPGPHVSVYYAQSAPTTPEAVARSQFEDSVWVPVSRDYTLQKGHLRFPPVRARLWKLEFTNLAAEPYEAMVPVTRTVRLFPPGVRQHEPRRGVAQDAMPPGLAAAVDVAGDRRFEDAVEVLNEQPPDDYRYKTTAALYATDPQATDRLHERSWAYGFQPWHIGASAPRFVSASVHRYDEIEVSHSSKTAFFVGLRQIDPVRAYHDADDDTGVYVDHFWDDMFLDAADGWSVEENLLTNGSDVTAVAESVGFASRHSVRALQFATSQSPPAQAAPDDGFIDPDLATSDWSDPEAWHRVGDATLLYSPADTSVLIHRSVAPIGRPVEHIPGLPQPVLDPVFRQETFTIEDAEAEAALFGGIESPALPVPARGRIYAAARFTLDSDLTNPVVLQITDLAGTVLIEKEFDGRSGEMVEGYVGYDLGSYFVPPPPTTVYQPRSGIIDRMVEPPFSDPPASTVPTAPPPPPPDDSNVRVRLIQRGKSDDLIRLDALSLFVDGLVWEFSVNDGVDWYEAKGIRNNANGVLVFPEPGTALRWRVSAVLPGTTVSSIRIRPWYDGIENARNDGAPRGPNVSAFDHFPPIQQDPEFSSWPHPIPQSWFYAYRNLPTLNQ